MKMAKYIIFQAESASETGWEGRKLSQTGALTKILSEHYDFSNSPLPKVGYRLREYYQIEPFARREFPSASTHSRLGDWEVIKVEEYKPERSETELESIVICYCKYSPVVTPLEPLPTIQVTQKLQEV